MLDWGTWGKLNSALYSLTLEDDRGGVAMQTDLSCGIGASFDQPAVEDPR